MGMVFCRGCGKEIHESAPTCPHCGALQSVKSTTTDTIPDGIKGWSWGAFLLGPIWAIGNKTWIGLLALVPYAGFIMSIVLGFKGREWAWKNKQWDSVEHFNRVQKKWSFWGVMIIVGIFVIGILAAIAIPAYQGYQHRAQEVATANEQETKHQAEVDKGVEIAINAIPNIIGEYIKENAVVNMTQQDKAVNFSINSAVGENTCDLEGKALMASTHSAVFVASFATGDKSDKCVARFDFADSGLKITTKDCDRYCGLNAVGSMDGFYQKK